MCSSSPPQPKPTPKPGTLVTLRGAGSAPGMGNRDPLRIDMNTMRPTGAGLVIPT